MMPAENNNNGNNKNNKNNGNWSITGREVGALEQELKEVRHDLRNLKLVMDLSGVSHITKEDIVKMRENLSNLNQSVKLLKTNMETMKDFSLELGKFKTRVYTVFSVVVMLTGIVGWLIDTVLNISS